MRHYGFRPQQIDALRTLYSLYQACGSSSYYGYSYGAVKSISLSRFESPQLWPMLDEVRSSGVRLVQQRTGHEVPADAIATICLDITATGSGGLRVESVLQVDGTPISAAGFIGSTGHGVVY